MMAQLTNCMVYFCHLNANDYNFFDNARCHLCHVACFETGLQCKQSFLRFPSIIIEP